MPRRGAGVSNEMFGPRIWNAPPKIRSGPSAYLYTPACTVSVVVYPCTCFGSHGDAMVRNRSNQPMFYAWVTPPRVTRRVTVRIVVGRQAGSDPEGRTRRYA